MDRRTAGVCVLLIALLATLVAPVLFRTGVSGVGRAAALPLPPPIGTCVILTETSVVPVDCDRSHDAEIFQSWPADDPRQPIHTAGACDQGLAAVAATSLPAGFTEWTPTVFNPSAELIRAPRSERVGSRGWLACLLRPESEARYVGSVIADTAGTGPSIRPSAFRRCLYYDRTTVVACGTPHSAEMLATSWRSVAIPTGTPIDSSGVPNSLTGTLQSECAGLARSLTGNADPTYGGQLSVVVVSSATGGFGTTDGAVAQFGSQCLLASDSRQLDDSVVDLGTAPLPTI